MEVILVVLIVYSQAAMVYHAHTRRTDQHAGSFFRSCNTFSITDYIEITRAENGKIGGWFWAFVLSLLLLLVVAANDFKAISGLPPEPPIHQDTVWPVL